jgi:hypothetical protein
MELIKQKTDVNNQKKRVVKGFIETTIDEDGVVKEQKRFEESYRTKEPDFIKLYIEDLVKLNDLPNSTNGVLYAILRYLNYKNEIVLISAIKKSIAEDLGIKVDTLNKSIYNLVDRGILSRLDRGLYYANPYVFGRGAWENVRAFRLTVKYDKDGRSFDVIKETQLELFDGKN